MLKVKTDTNCKVSYIEKVDGLIYVAAECDTEKMGDIYMSTAPNSLIIDNSEAESKDTFKLILSNDEDDSIIFEEADLWIADQAGIVVVIPYKQRSKVNSTAS